MKNSANLTTLVRTLLIFAIIYCLNLDSYVPAILGAALLLFVAILDGVDGYFARRYNNHNKLGGLIDTLGDRITENLLLIFFAYKQLISFWVPLIFVARSFVADFIRLVCFRAGIGTFQINRSKWGYYFVASKASRILYLVFKVCIFLLGTGILCISAYAARADAVEINFLLGLKRALFYGAWVLVVFNLIRFVFLIYDSRALLNKELLN